jgi:CDP-diacylglycerol---serine O-phosphatidyltransferase
VTALSWLMMVVVVGYLMVSTWRFYSFKDIDFRSRRPFRLVVLMAVIVASIWRFSRPALFVIAILYMASGVLWRLQWIFHRKNSACTSGVPGGISDSMTAREVSKSVWLAG